MPLQRAPPRLDWRMIRQTDMNSPPTPLLTIFNGPYEDRITTLIDILGFSRDVASLASRPGLIVSIEAVLTRLRKCKVDIDNARTSGRSRHDAKMTCFSDNIVLSYTRDGAARALADAAFISQTLLRGGYLPRGAITVGKLIHTEEIIFGAGLIEAAEAEKATIIMPCIALLPPFETLVEPVFAGVPEDKPLYLRSDAAKQFVHILGDQWPFLAQEKRDMAARGIGGDPIAEMYDEIRLALPIRHSNAPHEAAREKIRWMRDYVNQTIAEQGLPSHYQVVLS